MKKFILGLLVALVIFLFLIFSLPKPNRTISFCGLEISSLSFNSVVSFPVTVTGQINATSENKCAWTTFEGQAGTASLAYQNQGRWQILDTAPIKVVDWTTRPTSFMVTLAPRDSKVNLSPESILKISFQAEDPSGRGLAPTFDVPIRIR